MGFCALVYETTGAWSTPATKFVRQWARALAMKSGCPASQTFRSLAWAVSALVARSVGDHLVRARGLQPTSVPLLGNPPGMEVDHEPSELRAIGEQPLEDDPRAGAEVMQTSLDAIIALTSADDACGPEVIQEAVVAWDGVDQGSGPVVGLVKTSAPIWV